MTKSHITIENNKHEISQQDLETLSKAARTFYKGFKTTKKRISLPKHITGNFSFGITSLPSDNIDKIMAHQFEKDYNDKIKKQQDDLQGKMIIETKLRKERFTNRLRNDAIMKRQGISLTNKTSS